LANSAEIISSRLALANGSAAGSLVLIEDYLFCAA
jgi:hypothetical protein